VKKNSQIYGPHFAIDEVDYPVVHRLIAYFLRHESEAGRLGIDLNKACWSQVPLAAISPPA
jgi:hypothetical protein